MTITEPINDNSISKQKSLETVSIQKNQTKLVTKNYHKAKNQNNEITNVIKLTNIEKALQLLLADYIEENNIESSLRLRGGEGANINVPASYDQTTNGLTIIVNIPPIWEGSTGESAGQSRGFNLFSEGKNIFNALNQGEDYMKKEIDKYTGLGDTPLKADNIVAATKNALSPTIGNALSPSFGGLKLRSAPIGNTPASNGGSEYCSPGCTRKQDRKFPTSTPRNARRLDVEPMSGARGFSIGDMLSKADQYKQQFDNAYSTARNVAEQGREVFSSFGGVGSGSAAISNAQTPEADARGLDFMRAQAGRDMLPFFVGGPRAGRITDNIADAAGSRSAAISNAQTICECSESDARGLSFGDIMSKADQYKQQFDNAYSTARNVAEQGREVFSSFGGVGSGSAAISNAQTPEADARGFNLSDIDKYKQQFDNAYSTGQNVVKQGLEMVSGLEGVGSRSAAISNAQTICECGEADARGLNFGDIMNKADQYKNQFDNAYNTARNVAEQGREVFSSFGGVGSRSAAISTDQTPEADARGFNFSDIDKYKRQLDNAYSTGKNVADTGRGMYSSFGAFGFNKPARSLVGELGINKPYAGSLREKFGIKRDAASIVASGVESIGFNKPYAGSMIRTVNPPSVDLHAIANMFTSTVGSRSAAISNAQTVCECGEADARGLSFGDIMNTADRYKQQIDTTYNTVKNMSEQGQQLANSLGGLGLRSAPIADAKTPYISDEADPRGFDFSAALQAADKYKKQVDDVYNIGKNVAQQGQDIYDKFKGVGSRSAAISNAQTPCGCGEADARGLSFGDIMNKADQYKSQFDNAYNTARNVAEQGREVLSGFEGVGSRSAAISNAQTICECGGADARGLSFGDIMNKADQYKNQFDNAYSTARNVAEQGREVFSSFGGVGSRSAAISTAQTPEADARGFNLSDIGKYKQQFDNVYSTGKNVAETGRGMYSSFAGIGSNKSYARNVEESFGSIMPIARSLAESIREVEAIGSPRGFNLPDMMNTADNYKHQFDNAYSTAKNVAKQGHDVLSGFGGVGSRSAAISNAQTLCECGEADARGLNFGDIINKADQYKQQIDTTYNTVKNISGQGQQLVNSFGDLGLRSAPIADARTPYISDESDPRGFDFSAALQAADKYKKQVDDVYNIGKNVAQQGQDIYDKFKGVGSRSAAITNQSHGEGYCAPCGKQNASQVDSIKEQLDSAEARDNLLIDQVRQKQQARRMEVTQMLGNR